MTNENVKTQVINDVIVAMSAYIAADLMSQAEHDKLASAMLVTTSRELVEKVNFINTVGFPIVCASLIC